MKRGISLVVLSVAILVVMILASVLVVSLNKNYTQAQKIEFATELDMLQTAVENYKSSTGYYPITDETLDISMIPEQLKNTQFDDEELSSNNSFNVIDYDLIGVDNLKYGTGETYDDKFIVSTKTGKVYYAKGLKLGNETYYSMNSELNGLISGNNALEKNSEEEIVFKEDNSGSGFRIITYVPVKYSVNSVKFENVNIALSSITESYYEYELIPTTIGTVIVDYNNGSENKTAKHIIYDTDLISDTSTKKIYTLTFDANTGVCEIETIVQTEGYAIELPTPTKVGYDFLGWYTDRTSGQKVVYTKMPGFSQNLYAHWKASTYTLTYNANGGSVEPTSKIVTYDSAYGALVTPTRTGYSFDGWFTSLDGGNEVTKMTIVKTPNDHTIYAHWTPITYTIKYHQGNNSTLAGSTQLSGTTSCIYDQNVTLQAYGGTAPSGWTFAGWSTSQDGISVSVVNNVTLTNQATLKNLASTANEIVNLYAVFSKTINVYSGVNRATNNAKTQYYNPYLTTKVTAINLVTPSEITSWTALGYRTDTTATMATKAAGNVTPNYNETPTYYAVYSKKYTAHFYSGAGKATDKIKDSSETYYNTNIASVPTTTSITLETQANSTDINGWSELGWRDDQTVSSNEYNYSGTATVAFGTNFYSVYSRTLTIEYAANSGTGTVSNTTKTVYLNANSTTTSEQTVTLSNTTFSRIGYSFSKWRIGSTDYNKNTSYNPSLEYNASSWTITATAQWTPNEYNLTYDPNGGICTVASKKVTFASAYGTLTTPSRDGYTFLGWYTDKDNGTVVNSTTTVTVAGNHTIYAHWRINNVPPTKPSIAVYDRNTNYIKIRTMSTDENNDKLTYSYYIKREGNSTYSLVATSSDNNSGSYVILNAISLEQYTVYYCYVIVSDGKATATSDVLTTSTGCPGTGNYCSVGSCYCECSGNYHGTGNVRYYVHTADNDYIDPSTGKYHYLYCPSYGSTSYSQTTCSCGYTYKPMYEWKCTVCGSVTGLLGTSSGNDLHISHSGTPPNCVNGGSCTTCEHGFTYAHQYCDHGFTGLHFPN